MTRHQFLKASLALVSGGMGGAVAIRSFQTLRDYMAPRTDAPPRGDFSRSTDTQMLGAYHQAHQPIGFGGHTLVVWIDYACPSCATLLWQMSQTPFDPSKLRVVFRNYPLTSHPAAQSFAADVEAAEDQRRGDALRGFLTQQKGYGTSGKTACLKALGVDVPHWKRSGATARERVLKDKADAQQLGINGTPTLVLLSAAPPCEVFLKELSKYYQAV